MSTSVTDNEWGNATLYEGGRPIEPRTFTEADPSRGRRAGTGLGTPPATRGRGGRAPRPLERHDPTVAQEYDRHGRVNGGDPELMIEAAAADYMGLAASDTDALLIAADHALRRELSRRVQGNLLGLGLVDGTQTVTIADGTTAGLGDLIMCTRNDHRTEAGEPGRMLANGDLLRIDAVTSEGLLVRRALDPDRQTGRRRWTDRQFLYASYENAELGYAVTGHVAQGRTVRKGLAVLTGSEDRQHAYVALTRGTDENTAYVFTIPTKLADLTPGARPAPELARYDRLTGQAGHPGSVNPDDPGTTSAVSVLARIIGDRDGASESASQARQRALADADHLAVLHEMWIEQTTLERDRRYRGLLQSALPAGASQQPSNKEQWLHRTLRAAELAGLDPGEVLAQAVAERDLDGRPRPGRGDRRPHPPPPWRPRPAPGRRVVRPRFPKPLIPNDGVSSPSSPPSWTPGNTASVSMPLPANSRGRSPPWARSRTIPMNA